MAAYYVSWNVFPTSLLRVASQLLKLCGDNWLKLLCGSGLMLLKPVAKALIRHELAELTKLCIERLTVDGDVMHYQVRDGVIAGFSVHTGFPSNDPSSATRRTGRTDCNHDALAGFPAAHYWSSISYSWPSGTSLKIGRSEAVNNSAAAERIMVDKL